MERFWLGVKLVLLALVVILIVQNLNLVQVRLLTWSFSMPLALLIAALYLLGMVSGRSLMGLVRRLRGQQGHAKHR
ncbi:lipopolysaccharide assembly protein LapA domain-containing protein [Halomonas getboli]|uniref:lipopolysaccharide assembly protein LapA domain-containing protein n=1 Tax=Halomonas getboli TaxID=2935862 RepID=UPI001FFF4DB9|nr:lipopolysaccharide assembly protein LapA domain-containing protein [Halomonas getboli]MCK2183353.1 lipopolysaccharide assembly protein LapA domain-containing protein [Halomonas getboli]